MHRVVGRARESRSDASASNNSSSEDYTRSERDPVNVKMETSDEDFEQERERALNSSGRYSRQGFPAMKARLSEWIGWMFISRNATEFTSIPAENDNSSCSAELGEIQSNDEFNKHSKNGDTRNLVFSTTTFSPIVKYDSARSINDV